MPMRLEMSQKAELSSSMLQPAGEETSKVGLGGALERNWMGSSPLLAPEWARCRKGVETTAEHYETMLLGAASKARKAAVCRKLLRSERGSIPFARSRYPKTKPCFLQGFVVSGG
jgi:hypothetical protein